MIPLTNSRRTTKQKEKQFRNRNILSQGNLSSTGQGSGDDSEEELIVDEEDSEEVIC